MFHSCNFEFKKPTLLKKGTGIRNTYSAVASTPSLDRHKEILIPRGVLTEKFMTNPVMLNIHNHRSVPVGKVTNIKVSKEQVQFDFQFADTEEGLQLEKLYNNGFMNAFSVGFIPKNYIDLLTSGEGVTSLEVELPDGEKEVVDLTKYAEKPYGIISKWELLEISPVPIPANPDALMIRAKDEIVRKFIDAGNSKAAASVLDQQLSEQIASLQAELNSLIDKTDSVELSHAVPYQQCDAYETKWSNEDARAALVLWASTDKDHAGEADFIDWGKFAKGFGWIDLDRADKFVSYKLAHHTVEDEKLYVVLEGVTNAMADLLADQSIADAKDVYAHLARHYEDFGKDIPEFGKEYTAEQLEMIRSGGVVKESDEEPVEDNREPVGEEAGLTNEAVKTLVTKGFDELKGSIAELEEVVRLRMNILGKMFDDLHKELIAMKEQPKVEEPAVEDDEEVKLLAKELSSLSSMLEDINSVK